VWLRETTSTVSLDAAFSHELVFFWNKLLRLPELWGGICRDILVCRYHDRATFN